MPIPNFDPTLITEKQVDFVLTCDRDVRSSRAPDRRWPLSAPSMRRSRSTARAVSKRWVAGSHRATESLRVRMIAIAHPALPDEPGERSFPRPYADLARDGIGCLAAAESAAGGRTGDLATLRPRPVPSGAPEDGQRTPRRIRNGFVPRHAR